MLIPQKTRRTIFENLFTEGLIVAKKDFNAPKHQYIDAKNLYVIKACQALKSQGYVTERFAWRYYYWYLNDEGINYLRTYLSLTEEIVPNTLKKQAARPAVRGLPSRSDRGPRSDRGDRSEYRRNDNAEKKVGAGADFKAEF
eukprot:Ihof_evm1s789 gene=Ihof_evmTU1s789